VGLYSFSDGVAVDGVLDGLETPFELVVSLFVGEYFKSVFGIDWSTIYIFYVHSSEA